MDYVNTTSWFPKARSWRFFVCSANVTAVVDTHKGLEKLPIEGKQLSRQGWRGFFSAALKADDQGGIGGATHHRHHHRYHRRRRC